MRTVHRFAVRPLVPLEVGSRPGLGGRKRKRRPAQRLRVAMKQLATMDLDGPAPLCV